MKRICLLIITVAVAGGAFAQDNAALQKHYLKVYNHAVQYNDAAAAINALHGYLAVDNAEKSNAYKDTLSMLYFSTKNYFSSLLLADEVSKSDPSNTNAIERAGECFDELGAPDSAIKRYEVVAPKTREPYHLYKLAVCQYQLKRVGECEATIRAILSDTTSKKIGVPFTSMDGNQQAVSIAAAATNLAGVMRMDAKNFEDARRLFQQALVLFPNFSGAKENLAAVEKVMKTPAKTPGKTPPKTPGKTN